MPRSGWRSSPSPLPWRPCRNGVAPHGRQRVLRSRRPGAVLEDGLRVSQGLRVLRQFVGREHRIRLHDSTVRRQRLARLLRAQGEYRERQLHVHRRRRRLERRWPALLDSEFRQRRHRREAGGPCSSASRSLVATCAWDVRRDSATRTCGRLGTDAVARSRACDGGCAGWGHAGACHLPQRTVAARRAVAFVHLDTGRKLTSGDVRCRAEVAGKRLRVRMNAFRSGSARCAWQIPAWAKGKKVTGVVALQIGDSAARRLFVRVFA